jgi:aldehyde:ferredoxin oxidoreductase
MDKILRIDVGASGGPAVKTEDLGDYAGLGGRAMTSAIVSKEVPPTCHPLGDANKLVIAPGLLSGSAAAISGRVSVGCKSPLTGGIKEANSGGQGAQVMGRLGYAAIILEGKASNDSLYKVVINKDGVKLAGEMKMAAATIAVTDREMRPSRHAGRGGVGAVMGTKGIKAIIIDDAGTKMRQPKNPEKFKAANKTFTRACAAMP